GLVRVEAHGLHESLVGLLVAPLGDGTFLAVVEEVFPEGFLEVDGFSLVAELVGRVEHVIDERPAVGVESRAAETLVLEVVDAAAGEVLDRVILPGTARELAPQAGEAVARDLDLELALLALREVEAVAEVNREPFAQEAGAREESLAPRALE